MGDKYLIKTLKFCVRMRVPPPPRLTAKIGGKSGRDEFLARTSRKKEWENGSRVTLVRGGSSTQAVLTAVSLRINLVALLLFL